MIHDPCCIASDENRPLREPCHELQHPGRDFSFDGEHNTRNSKLALLPSPLLSPLIPCSANEPPMPTAAATSPLLQRWTEINMDMNSQDATFSGGVPSEREGFTEVQFLPQVRSGWARKTFAEEKIRQPPPSTSEFTGLPSTRDGEGLSIVADRCLHVRRSIHTRPSSLLPKITCEPVPVKLQVYDLTDLTQKSHLHIYHLGIEIFSHEYFYGVDGIQACTPKCHSAHKYREEVHLGTAKVSFPDVIILVHKLRQAWTPAAYTLFGHNCQSFAVAFCSHLGVEVPSQYCRYSMLGPSAAVYEGCTSLIRQPLSSCSFGHACGPPPSRPPAYSTINVDFFQPSVARPSARPTRPSKSHIDDDPMHGLSDKPLQGFASSVFPVREDDGNFVCTDRRILCARSDDTNSGEATLLDLDALCDRMNALPQQTSVASILPFPAYYRSHFRGAHLVERTAQGLFKEATSDQSRAARLHYLAHLSDSWTARSFVVDV